MIAPAGPVASAVTESGTIKMGGVVSTTVTLKLALALPPFSSVAVQVTSVDPGGKVEPDCGSHSIAGFAVTISVAVAVKEAMAPEGPVASTVTEAGTVKTGGVLSVTIM